MSYLRNNLGFSLIEVVLALALLGGASLAFLKFQENMTKGQLTSETKLESLEIGRVITSTLIDRGACMQTLGGRAIGTHIDSIKSSSGSPIFEVGKTYSQLKIASITTIDKNQMNTDGTRAINLQVRFEKVKTQAYSQPKNFNLHLTVNASSATGMITDCLSDNQLVLRAACESLGGTWVGSKCDLPKCPGNQVLSAINSDGTAVCRAPIVGGSCGSGQYVSGIDNQGVPTCASFPVTSSSPVVATSPTPASVVPKGPSSASPPVQSCGKSGEVESGIA